MERGSLESASLCSSQATVGLIAQSVNVFITEGFPENPCVSVCVTRPGRGGGCLVLYFQYLVSDVSIFCLNCKRQRELGLAGLAAAAASRTCC